MPGEGTAAQGSDEAAAAALAEHLGVAPEAVKEWLDEPQAVPSPVLRGWVRLWHRRRR